MRRRHRRTVAVLARSVALSAVAITLSVGAQPRSELVDLPRWRARLEALRPEQPMAYFELAEELADRAVAEGDLRVARDLFGLAGVLDPARLGPSACLALADLETRDHVKQRMRALAMLLSERSGSGWAGGGGDAVETLASPGAVVAVADALSYYRRGMGPRALTALRRGGAMELIRTLDHVLPGGVERFLEDCRVYRGGQSVPRLTDDELTLMLRVEAALLAGRGRSWSGELLLSGGRPLIDVDPERLEDILAVDARRPYYRRGRWASTPGRPSPANE